MENEAKKTYEVTITTTFRYRTTVEASSKREAEDIATREIVEDSGIDVCDTDDIDTDVEACPVEGRVPDDVRPLKGDDLPTTVMVSCGEVGIGASTAADEAADILSDWLSDTYGFCHYGFDYEIVDGTVIVSGIKWDVDGEDPDDE